MEHYELACVLSVICVSFVSFVQTIKFNETGCEWGTWLPWDCLCCGKGLNFPVYRLRTKCCMDTTNCESFKPCNGSIRFVEDEGFIGKGFCLNDCPHHCNNRSSILLPCVPKVNRTEKITAKEMEASCTNLRKVTGRLPTSTIKTNISFTNKTVGVILTFSSSPSNESAKTVSSQNSADFTSAWNTHAAGNTSLSTNDIYVNCPTTTETTTEATTTTETTITTTKLTAPSYTSAFLNSSQTFETVVMVTSTSSDNRHNEAKETNKDKRLIGIILGTVSGSLVGGAVLVTLIIILKKKRATTSITADQKGNKIESCSAENRTQSA